MVVAALVEAVTEVAAEATVAESTHSIQLYPVKSKRASWANPTVGPASSCPPISSSFRCCHFVRIWVRRESRSIMSGTTANSSELLPCGRF